MLRSILLCAAAIAIAAPAFAHHGAGTFELGKTVSFTAAKLTKVELLNPHGWLYFETTEPDGKVMKHRCEMRSAHVLRRSGWSPELFKSGEKVDITASPDRADVASCYLQTIVFANGSRMDRYGQYVKAPTGERQGSARPHQAGESEPAGAAAERRAEHHRRLGARTDGDGESARRRRRYGASQRAP